MTADTAWTPARLQALASELTERARRNLERGGALMPLAVVIRPNSEADFIGLQYASPAQKRAAYAIVREHARAACAVAVILIQDTFAAIVQDGAPGAAERLKRASAHGVEQVPGRAEALCTVVLAADGWREMRLQPYERIGTRIRWHDATTSHDCDESLVGSWAAREGA